MCVSRCIGKTAPAALSIYDFREKDSSSRLKSEMIMTAFMHEFMLIMLFFVHLGPTLLQRVFDNNVEHEYSNCCKEEQGCVCFSGLAASWDLPLYLKNFQGAPSQILLHK